MAATGRQKTHRLAHDRKNCQVGAPRKQQVAQHEGGAAAQHKAAETPQPCLAEVSRLLSGSEGTHRRLKQADQKQRLQRPQCQRTYQAVAIDKK